MNSGHESLSDAPIVVDDLSDGGEAVSGAGGVRYIGQVWLVLVVVDSHNEDGGVILGGCRHDDLFGTSLDVSLGLLLAEVDSSALGNILTASSSPLNLAGVLLLEDLNGLAVDLDASLDSLDIALEPAYSAE
jgi:hypothetical protein